VSRTSDRAAGDLSAGIGEVKRGSLRVFGDWFGRPLDNIHIARRAVAEDDDLVVTFDEDEQLRISSPSRWTFDNEVFRVERARRVVWTWFYYGRPKLAENRFTIEHWIDADGAVCARSDVTWYRPEFPPSAGEPAAELL
jgi:hypothetical protein